MGGGYVYRICRGAIVARHTAGPSHCEASGMPLSKQISKQRSRCHRSRNATAVVTMSCHIVCNSIYHPVHGGFELCYTVRQQQQEPNVSLLSPPSLNRAIGASNMKPMGKYNTRAVCTVGNSMRCFFPAPVDHVRTQYIVLDKMDYSNPTTTQKVLIKQRKSHINRD